MYHLEYKPHLKGLTKRLNGCVHINLVNNFWSWKLHKLSAKTSYLPRESCKLTPPPAPAADATATQELHQLLRLQIPRDLGTGLTSWRVDAFAFPPHFAKEHIQLLLTQPTFHRNHQCTG